MKNRFNILIVSSRDIVLEQKIVLEICSGINEGLFPNPDLIRIKADCWKETFKESSPEQDIFKKISADYDMILCIFHKTFITTPESTTSALINYIKKYIEHDSMARPDIRSFFKEVKITSSADFKDQQLMGVFDLKEKIEASGKIHMNDFSKPQEFCEKVHSSLELLLYQNS